MATHQTFSPATCECVIEQEVDDNGNVSLLFFHTVCAKHEPIVKNKPKLSKQDLDKKRKEVSDKRLKLLSDNRIKNLKQFDDHPQRKQVAESIAEIKRSQNEQLGLKLEAKFNEERMKVEHALDRHEDKSMDELLIGIHSPYAFNSQEVYDAISEEQKKANG